jgi:shikimate kinase
MKEKTNIILIGFMGSGKTSVGKYLAKKTGYDFKDTDEMIEEKQKCSVQSIFASNGEKYFRKLETETIENLNGKLNHTILSTGGGLPITEGNGALLRQLGQVIFLRAEKATIKNRLAGDKSRPLLAGDDQEDKMEALLKFRTPIYETVANIIIHTDQKSLNEIAQEIIDKL